MASRANVPLFHELMWTSSPRGVSSTRQARTHGDLLDLLAGQPSTGRRAPVATEATCGCSTPVTRSARRSPAAGILELREAIAAHHERTHGIDVHPDEVVVTTGSSGGFLLAFLAAFEVGDRVAMARPGYPATATSSPRSAARSSRSRPGPQTRFQPTVEQVAELGDVRDSSSPAPRTDRHDAAARRARRAGVVLRRPSGSS